ncbi:MAG: flagellar basal-body rod protein FlgF [Pseudomonadota bacterium]
MENAELVGLSRQVTLKRQLSVVANNLANMNTSGFKAESSLFEEHMRSPARHNGFERRDRAISFVHDDRTLTDLSKGAIVRTENPTDMALADDQFFTIQMEDGENLYTRNGAFVIDNQGQLVTTEGRPVAGAGGGPIVFAQGDTNITVARDGTVSTDQGIRGQLAIVTITNEDALTRREDNLFASDEAAPAVSPGVSQGFIEKSNVKAVLEVARMIEITRAYERIAKQIQRQDEIRRDAIRKLGKLDA